ncbi:hypothetical protein ACFOOP_02115 [Marinicaulis aureus]|uniref:HTH HARE-type domain-containing protein n=1 Tax=Hyphococcus aureus TaxID=2666033 RepID=A0ABW1KXV7_9PROT
MSDTIHSRLKQQRIDDLRAKIDARKRERDRIRADLTAIQLEMTAQITDADDDIIAWDKKLAALEDRAPEEVPAARAPFASRVPSDAPQGPYSNGYSQPQALEAELKASPPREPLHYKELWRRIAAKGFRTEAEKPEDIVRQNLRKRAMAPWSPVFEERKGYFALIDWYSDEELKRYGINKDVKEDNGMTRRMTRTAEGIQAVRERGARWGGVPAFTAESWEWASRYWRDHPELSDHKMAEVMAEQYKGAGKKKLSWGTFRKWKQQLMAGEPYHWPQWAEDHPDVVMYPPIREEAEAPKEDMLSDHAPKRPTLVYDHEEGVVRDIRKA